jgi:hypothetical protein
LLSGIRACLVGETLILILAGLALAQTLPAPGVAVDVIVVLLARTLTLPAQRAHDHLWDRAGGAFLLRLARGTALGTFGAEFKNRVEIVAVLALGFGGV